MKKIAEAARDKRIAGVLLTGALSPSGYGSGYAALKEVRAALEPKLSDVDKKVVAYLDSIESELGPTPLVTPVGGGNFGTVQMRMVQDLIFNRKNPLEAATGLHDEVKNQLK